MDYSTMEPCRLAEEAPLALKRREWTWILYDCANSAYALAISTALFPVLFGMYKGDSLILGYVNSIAGLIIALLSPILGTIADYKDKKKRFFLFFFLLGVLATLSLSFVPQGAWKALALFYILSSIGYSGGNIFYDSFLVDVTTEERSDLVSTRGYAYGYIASILPFILSLLIIKFLGLERALGYQMAFAITAIWWATLTLPMLRHVRQIYWVAPEGPILRQSFGRLLGTFRELRSYRVIFLFLVAYFFYIDGVSTLIRMVIPFAQTVLGGEGFSTFFLLAVLLLIQIVAFPFALLFGRLAKRLGTLFMIRVAIVIYVFVVVYAYFIHSMFDCVLLGCLVAFAQGGIQSLSRSYFSRLIPKTRSNEFFGFYNVFGKFSAIIGPALMTLVAELTGQPRTAILALLPLFLIGLIISLRLPKETARAED